MKFPTHIHTIRNTLPLYGTFPLSKHCYLIWFKQNPIIMANIIKLILQMKKLKHTEAKSLAWDHKVVMWQSWIWNRAAWLQVQDPFCYAMQHSLGWDAVPNLQKDKNQITCPESRTVWVAVEPELDTKSPESVVSVPSQGPLSLARMDGNSSLKGNSSSKDWALAELVRLSKSGHQGPTEGYLYLVSYNLGSHLCCTVVAKAWALHQIN